MKLTRKMVETITRKMLVTRMRERASRRKIKAATRTMMVTTRKMMTTTRKMVEKKKMTMVATTAKMRTILEKTNVQVLLQKNSKYVFFLMIKKCI